MKRFFKPIRESDLYQPISEYLSNQGYTVRAEVNHCDITAVKGENLVVIELKRGFNATLLMQAADRQKITDSVYVALPYPQQGIRSKKWQKIKHLLRRLELGLILISFHTNHFDVEIVFHPIPFDRKKKKNKRIAILQEMKGRSGDYNQGGSVQRKLVTAYREEAIHIACCLEKHGPLTPRELRALGTGSKTQSILYNNHYGWFERIGRSVYELKESAKTEMSDYSELVQQYRKHMNGE